VPFVANFIFGKFRAYLPPEREGFMKTAEGSVVKKTFLDIPNAAELAGFSVRHFRRIIEEERIRIVQIGRKFFILGADFERWQTEKRLKAS
jgi:helix-turn-helix protein